MNLSTLESNQNMNSDSDLLQLLHGCVYAGNKTKSLAKNKKIHRHKINLLNLNFIKLISKHF